jgi:hypothetical protein
VTLARSIAISLSSLVFVTFTYPVFIVILIFIAFSNPAPNCGLGATDLCKDPNANEWTNVIVALIAFCIFVAVVSWIPRAIMRRGVPETAVEITGFSLWAFSIALAAIPGAAWVVVLVLPGAGHDSVLLAVVFACCSALLWGYTLARVARPGV